MIRKLLLVAAAIAMPASAGAVALVGTATVAGAAPTAINCRGVQQGHLCISRPLD